MLVIVHGSRDRVQSWSGKLLKPHLSPSQRWSLSPPSPLRGDSTCLKAHRCPRCRQARNLGSECRARKGSCSRVRPGWLCGQSGLPRVLLSHGCVWLLGCSGPYRCRRTLLLRVCTRSLIPTEIGIRPSGPVCNRCGRCVFDAHHRDRYPACRD